MFKLFRMNVDKYLILFSNGKKLEYTYDNTIKALLLLGVAEEEIMHGMLALETDDMADYGVNLTFLFSKKIA